MDLLPNKLDRLTPEQRREVEDFVDFLLFRSDNQPAVPREVAPVPPIFSVAPPPLEPAPVLPAQEIASSTVPASPLQDERPASPIHEIGAGEDGITRDYMDYGKFDQTPSPATEAVKKVKRKLVQREEQDKSRQLLDWVD
jgi:hypothetical protein